MKQSILLGLSFLYLATVLSAQEVEPTVEKVQKSLITKRTATWCPICGQPEIWPMVKNLNTNLQSKALVISGHHASNSTLHSSVARELIDNFESAFSQPVFYFNRERIGSGGTETETLLMNRAEEAYTQAPLAQTGLNLHFDESQRLLEVSGRAEFYENTSGNYQLAYYLIRKSIIASQSSRGSDTEHINVLWSAITANSFGVSIDQESLIQGGYYTHTERYSLPDEIDINNVIVAAVIWKDNGEGVYEFVNVEFSDNIQTGVATSTSTPIGLESFRIQPNLTQGLSMAVLNLSSSLPGSDLSIYDALGNKVQTVFQGELLAGTHHFQLQVSTPGVYFVALSAANRISTQRLIKLK